MENFVFEADIIVPRLEYRRHRFVLDREAMANLIADIPPIVLGAEITVDDLREIVNKEGQIMNILKLTGDTDTRDHILKTLAAHAWLSDVPWTVTQSKDNGPDDPRFGHFIAAYMESSG